MKIMQKLIKICTIFIVTLNLNTTNADEKIKDNEMVEAEVTGYFNSLNQQTIKIITENMDKTQNLNSEEKDRKIVMYENGNIVFTNDKFLPCSTCLGINGGYVDLLKKTYTSGEFDSFTIILESGAAERQMLYYTFRFDEKSKEFKLIGEDEKTIVSFCKEPFEDISINYITNIKIIKKLKCTNEQTQDTIVLKNKITKINSIPQFLKYMNSPFE